jgi:glycosyltransferase involved in cell wall biosynthesis
MLRKKPSVSVVIRTRNMESRLSELLLELSRQTLRPSEVVVVDNFSGEGTLQKMTGFLSSAKTRFFKDQTAVKLVPVPDSEFSHAYSTNAGILFSEGELVCITNGHSLPFSKTWLESGVAHFRDPEVVGVGGYSTPHTDGTVWEKLAYRWSWKEFNEISRMYAKDSYFSTINCVLRRALWEEYPFDEKLPDEIPLSSRFGGEDYDWATEMLARRHKIVVEPMFCVYHSHGDGLSVLASKYIVWRRIRKRIATLSRPRESFTKIRFSKPRYFDL